MVKSYFRYEPSDTFGIITSPTSNVLYDSRGKLAIAPGLQNVLVWNIRQGTKTQELIGDDGEVNSLSLSPDGESIAAGYSTGVIRIFSLSNGLLKVTLDGHKSAVVSLQFNLEGSLLVSSSRDTDIIVWDIVTQAGLYRLRGHKDEVTGVRFLHNSQYVVSVSKDTLLKVWDLETQHCIQTCVGHHSEIWCVDIDPQEKRLVTGSSNNQIRVYSIEEKDNITSSMEVLKYLGSFARKGNERCVTLLFNKQGTLLGCQANNKTLEIYRIRNEAEKKKKYQRRLKRRREKLNKQSTEVSSADIEITTEELVDKDEILESVTDEMELLTILRSTHKLRSFAFSPTLGKDGSLNILLGLQNNSLEEHQLSSIVNPEAVIASKTSSLVLQGHRSDIRATALSSNDEMLVSVSSSLVKIWNCSSMECIRTLTTDLGLCAAFLPGNKHVVVGTKNGDITIFDLSSGDITFQEKAHEGALWSLDVTSDGIATGGADHLVKFWDFELLAGTSSMTSSRSLGLVHTRTLKMASDVLCVRYSNSKDKQKRLIAVALLDCTIKIFFYDSLKFFLSLYGHKLPVMSMDISSDDSMIVTASADKNLKIWGLDFGDCHKSIFAHEQSIMCIRFIYGTHYFLSCSKDNIINYWDGDSFEKILSLEGHKSEVWSLSVSHAGDFFISCSHDRSLRKWKRTEDQVFLEEEREKELEKTFEQQELQQENNQMINGFNGESAPAGKKTVATVIAGERLMEAIENADLQLKEKEEYERNLEKGLKVPAFKENPLLLGFTPLKFILKTLRSISLQELDEALLLLPFPYVERLVEFLLGLIAAGLDIEICCHCVLSLLRIHHKQVVANHSLLEPLHQMWESLRIQLQKKSDEIGFNLAGLEYLKRQSEQENIIIYNNNDLIASKKPKISW